MPFIYFLFLDKRSSLLNEQKRDNESCPYQEKRFPQKQCAVNQREDSQRQFDYKRDLPTYSEAYRYKRNLDANRQKRDIKAVPNYSYKRETTPYNYCRRDSGPLTHHKRDISSA
ncbi:12658_t:CDS:2 [Dentiscutata heterogama]|uniref:12658_t:CDS:1 n=1 Tax=Dentiscutata heterogama TaxID=1316150 RepID=A0ACA9LUX6_9GLOM|nr:12658_t:CDS:2 [Dentiscutata heterogama]